MSAKRKTTTTEAPSLAMRVAAARRMTEGFTSKPESAPQQPAEHSFGMSVEDQLVALNERYEDFVGLYDEAGAFETTALSRPPLAQAVELAETHALRIMRAIVREALGLPAASVLAFALQARLIAAGADDLWNRDETDHYEGHCRSLLDGLLGAAGLSRIRRPDVTPNELRGWLVDPRTDPGRIRYREEAQP